MAGRVSDAEKTAIKNYHNAERNIGKFDLNPAFTSTDPKVKSPSPLLIEQELIAQRYHQANKQNIIEKLNIAINEATTAQTLWHARNPGVNPDPDEGHQLRINTYQNLVDNPATW